MGMFDEVEFADAESAPKCSRGHAITDWQTKSLMCQLRSFYIIGDRFLLADVKWKRNTEERDGRTLQISTRELRPWHDKAYVHIHTKCYECEEGSWYECRIHVCDGKVLECEPLATPPPSEGKHG